MRPALLLILSLGFVWACSMPGPARPLSPAAPPKLVPLDQVIAAPAPVATDEMGEALDARAKALRAQASQP